MLLRRIGLALCGLALTLGSCGRQITSDSANGVGSNGLVSGTMTVTFRTQAALDYNNVGYWIVFNTTGSGTSPYANYLTGNPQNYSYAFVLGNIQNRFLGQSPTQTVQLFQYYVNAAGSTSFLARQILSISPAQLQAVVPGNGQANQFTITFQRSLLNQVPPSSPCNLATAAPGATPTAVPTGGSTPSALATPCGQTAPTWFVNFFTTDTSGNPLDALGTSGVQNQTVSIALPVTSAFDDTQDFIPPAGVPTVANPSAQITGGEIINAP